MTSNFQHDFQQAINLECEAFVTKVSEIARKAAMEMLQSALDQNLGGTPGVAGGARRPGPGLLRRKGGKRSPDEIAAIAEELYQHIQSNPGQRMEDIAKALDSTSKDLTLPLKKLQNDKRIRVEGQKRATSYYVNEPKRRRGRKAKKKAA